MEHKEVLITAGPTWVPIDDIRIITSIFSGETGLQIARFFVNKGIKVTLLMGPGRAKFYPQDWGKMHISQFFYYEEIKEKLEKFLKEKHFDCIIHLAAISDYALTQPYKGKIRSNKKNLQISLQKTKKLISLIRELSPKSFLIKFKLEVNKTENELIEIAKKSFQEKQANLLVINDLRDISPKQHIAYIFEHNKELEKVSNKEEIAKALYNKFLHSKA